jgi:hypothetical protein
MVGVAAALVAGHGVTGGGEAQAGELDGKYTLLQVTMTVTEVPMLGPMKTTTTVVSVHDLVNEGDRLRGKGTLCDITVLGERDLLETTILPRLRKVLPPPEIDARLIKKNGKLTFFHKTPTIVLGAKLRTPDDEQLPVESRDHRVFDQDLDGKPGVTLRVKGMAEGDIHLVQRMWTRLDGWQREDGSFGGVARHGLTQSVLGATAPMLRQPPTNVPTADGSYFRLGRLEKGACPEALAQAKTWGPKG